MKLKSQNKTVMFIKGLSKQMETKKIFVKIYYLIWEPPAHSFLIESMVPFPDLLWGGGVV